jgi:cbb3-type cytochrome oxidase maturation protein
LIAFLWSVKSGQYSDTYTPSVRMLFDDEKSENNKQKKSDKENKIDN